LIKNTERVKNDIVITDELIGRYLAGEAGPDEAMDLQEWLKDRENRLRYEALAASWDAAFPEQKPREVRSAHAWAELEEKMQPLRVVKKKRLASASRNLWLRVAASVVLLIGVGVFMVVRLGDEPVPMHQLATADAIREFILPDSSTAVLHKNSEIEYREAFKGKTREVNFKKGEAFFRVAHNLTKPFIIHTTLADIQVVGTAFNVEKSDRALEISVDEGKVLVITSAGSHYLEKGAHARIEAGDAEPVQLDRAADSNAWGYATRRFSFKDTPMNQVVQRMEKAYPFTIEFSSPSLGNCKLTATFDHLSAEEMLTLIAETLNFKVTKHDTVYILEGNGCL
jgi:ferric-dicitrate binding protein FerR (iron transport regulator)